MMTPCYQLIYVETHRAAPNGGTEPETIARQDGVGRGDTGLARPTEEARAERVERHGLGTST